jgi:SAM-dependent methyltransferase
MSVFGAYSRYYNLLYRDKDYGAEAEYIHRLVQKHKPGAKSLLDLGCGTGRHDLLLAGMGYSITGVDMSEEMLSMAKKGSGVQGFKGSDVTQPEPKPQPVFLKGDVRTVRIGRKFDAVISLFHVMSYQVGNEDLASAFKTAREHLGTGGIFVFDCWYGPAVLTDRPARREKVLEDSEIHVTRIAEPVMHPNENVVDVKYHVLVKDKATGRVEVLDEVHRMRYLFAPEVRLMLGSAGFELEAMYDFLTENAPGFGSWGACFVGRRV